MMEPKRPPFIRVLAHGTFSTAVIVANSRMFWNVRETPRDVMMSGRLAVMSRPRR